MPRHNQIVHAHSLLNHVRFVLKKRNPLLLVAMVVMLIGVVSLHVVGGMALVQTGLGGFSFRHPLSFVLMGLVFVLALFKLKHVLSFVRRKGK